MTRPLFLNSSSIPMCLGGVLDTEQFLGIFDTKREALAARRAAVKEITCEGDAGEHRTE